MEFTIKWPEISLALICFFFICYLTRHGNPWNWPLLGMLPSLSLHVHRIHERCARVLELGNCTFLFKGPWFAHMDVLITCDPANVHHIMSSNFANYPKGPDFREIFDVLGDGIFNSDGDLWRFQRRATQHLLNHRGLHRFLIEITCRKVVEGVVPLLERACVLACVVDMQDVFQRFAFDATCLLVTGHDARSLGFDLPHVPFSRALDVIEEAIAYRHALPESVWKLERWLGVGHERKLSRAWKDLDEFIEKCISMKQQECMSSINRGHDDGVEEGEDMLSSILKSGDNEQKGLPKMNDEKFLRDFILNMMIAGRDTTSSALTWFLWLVMSNPRVQEKIREEIEAIVPSEKAQEWYVLRPEESDKLVYLHAALCESLRLYPPVTFQHKCPRNPDTLPSGHEVKPGMKIMFPLYAMGRMTTIWGKDAREFRPERWISERGNIKHEPSYKFMSFNAGPRTCLGKEVAFTQMKLVASTLIHNYDFVVMEGHRVSPDVSVILHMTHGLMVRVYKRWSSN